MPGYVNWYPTQNNTTPVTQTQAPPMHPATGDSGSNGMDPNATIMPNGTPMPTNTNGNYVEQAGVSVNAHPTAPMNYQEQANLFNMPNQAGQAAAIQGAYNLQQAPNYANSPLAGLTTLGATAGAGAAYASPTNINTAASQGLTAAQLQNINALNQQAQGQGPSVAATAAKQQAEQNVANQMAMMGSQRGASNSALGLRQAQNAAAQANQQGVQSATLGRAQEELNAQNQLNAALGQTQGQVQQGAQAQAQLSAAQIAANQQAANALNAQNVAAQNTATQNQGQMNQTVNLANQGAQGQAQALNANEYNAALQAQMALNNNTLTANQNYANLVSNANLTRQDIDKGLQVNSTNNMMGLVGAGIAGGAALLGTGGAAASDRNLKTNIQAGSRSIKDFLSQLGVSSDTREQVGGFNLWA